MKKDIKKIIELPEGFTAKNEGNALTVEGNGKSLTKNFNFRKVQMKIDAAGITLSAKKATKRELTTIGTASAHINNLIKGLQNDFEYILEVCNVHFPMNVKVEGDKVIIKSFLGEKENRQALILPDVKVDVKGSKITVQSPYIEKAGQTAANIEKATKLTGRDRRIFQDGIFISSKNNKLI